jgi:NAD(P)-dependent dehydrogenase (short-subunit alcohol dehydrogenase family)
MDDSPVVLVTGAGGGIGRACARALANTGARVVITDINEAGAEETHRLIAGADGDSTFYKLDVTDEHQWDRVISDVEQKHGQVSTLVNNAALKTSLVPKDRALLDIDLATWDLVLNVNLRGPMLGSRRVVPAMLDAGRGSIIMINSINSFVVVPNRGTVYATSKAGLYGLMRAVAASYGPHGVRCNAVAPGVTLADDASVDGDSASSVLTGRDARGKDIADAVVFLASEAASFINGQMLIVDGGLTAHMQGTAGLP